MIKLYILLIWLNGIPLYLELGGKDHCEQVAKQIKEAHNLPGAIHVCIAREYG